MSVAWRGQVSRQLSHWCSSVASFQAAKNSHMNCRHETGSHKHTHTHRHTHMNPSGINLVARHGGMDEWIRHSHTTPKTSDHAPCTRNLAPTQGLSRPNTHPHAHVHNPCTCVCYFARTGRCPRVPAPPPSTPITYNALTPQLLHHSLSGPASQLTHGITHAWWALLTHHKPAIPHSLSAVTDRAASAARMGTNEASPAAVKG